MKQHLLTFPKQRKTKQTNGSTLLRDQEEYVSGATYLARFSKHSMLGRIASFNRQLDPASDSNMYFLLNRTRVGATVTFPQGAKCMFGDCPLGDEPPSYCGPSSCNNTTNAESVCIYNPNNSDDNYSVPFYLLLPELRVCLAVVCTYVVNYDAVNDNCCFTGNYYGDDCSCYNAAAAQAMAMWYYTPTGVDGYYPTIFQDERTGLKYTVSDFVSTGNVASERIPVGYVVASSFSVGTCYVTATTTIACNFSPECSPFTCKCKGSCSYPTAVYNSINSPNCVITFTSPAT